MPRIDPLKVSHWMHPAMWNNEAPRCYYTTIEHSSKTSHKLRVRHPLLLKEINRRFDTEFELEEALKQLLVTGPDTDRKLQQVQATMAPRIEKEIDKIEAKGKSYKNTRYYNLKRILNDPISHQSVLNLEAHHYKGFCDRMTEASTLDELSPASLLQYMTTLQGILTQLRFDDGIKVDKFEFELALHHLRTKGIIGKSNTRDRRPTIAEVELLFQAFVNRFTSGTRTRKVPMPFLWMFATFSGRREGEIVRLKWDDMDFEDDGRGWVRKIKHPTKKEWNDKKLKFPAPAQRIINMMPRVDERIFPYSAEVISRHTTEAVRYCGIHDLHFHDLRHEALSYLAEQGLTTLQLKEISGHDTTEQLERYVNKVADEDKYANTDFLDRLEAIRDYI